MRLFKESLTDFLALCVTVLILVTGFRAIYLIAILSVNGHITYFNRFLTKITDNPKMWIKLQQIKTVLEDPEKKKQMHMRYLSLKHCIWLAFIEWILDLWVLPFIVTYMVCLPWRINELFALAVTQYDSVPA